MNRSTRAALLAASSLVLTPGLAHSASNDSTVLGTFETTASDSSEARSLYGVVTYSNPASSRSLEASGGALTYRTAMTTEPNQGYSAVSGLLLPMEPLWGLHDLRGATSVSFRVKANQRIRMQVGIGSNAYAYGDQGIILQVSVPVTTEWTTVNLDLAPFTDLAFPAWVDEGQYPGVFGNTWITDPSDPLFDSDSNIAKSVKNLSFAIEATFTAAGYQVMVPAGTLELSIDDVVLHGVALDQPPVVEPPPGPRGHGHHHGHSKPRPPRKPNGCHEAPGNRR